MTDASLSLKRLFEISIDDKSYFLLSEQDLIYEAFKLSNQEDFAKYYHKYNINNHVYNSLLGWFSLNENNIWEPRGIPGSPLLYGINLIAEFYRKQFQGMVDKLNDLNKSTKIEIDTKKTLIKPVLTILKELIKKAGTASVGKAICSYLNKYYLNDNLINLMDKKTNIFPFKNKVIEFDIENPTFYEIRKAKPDDWISETTGYDLPELDKVKLNKTKEDIMKFLKSILNDDKVINYLLWFVARGLDGSKTGNCQSFVVWNGNGANGKSKLANLCQNTFGDFFHPISASTITKPMKESSKACPDLAKARNKRIVSCQEPEPNDKLQEGIIKEITGGTAVSFRTLSKEAIAYIPTYMLMIQTNTIPDMKISSTNAMQRRMKIISFLNTFKQANEIDPNDDNPFIKQADMKVDGLVLCEEWRFGFLYILLDIFSKFKYEEPELPEIVREEGENYFGDLNIIKDYLLENYDINVKNDKGEPVRQITATQLLTHYNNTITDKYKKINAKHLKALMAVNNISQKRAKDGVYYLGIRAKSIIKPVEPNKQKLILDDEIDELDMK